MCWEIYDVSYGTEQGLKSPDSYPGILLQLNETRSEIRQKSASMSCALKALKLHPFLADVLFLGNDAACAQ